MESPRDTLAVLEAWAKIVGSVFVPVVVLILGQGFNANQRRRDEDQLRLQEARNAEIKQQELKVSQAQTVATFMPYLTGSDQQQNFAFITLTSMGNAELVARLAELRPTKGAVAALAQTATSSVPETRRLSAFALSQIARSSNGASKTEAATAVAAATLRLGPIKTTLRYTYQWQGHDCPGYFRLMEDGTWVETTPGDNECLATLYYFAPDASADGSVVLRDASRGYFLRLPTTGDGWAELATSKDGPWSNLHRVSRES